MRKISVICFIVSFTLSCDWEMPTNPFNKLDANEVVSPMNALDSGLNAQNSFMLEALFDEEITGKIAVWDWEIEDFFGNSVDLSYADLTKSSVSIQGLPADQYIILLTVADAEGNYRVFTKQINVTAANIDMTLAVDGMDGEDDSGAASDDRVTNVNNALTVFGSCGDAGVELTLKVVNVGLSVSLECSAVSDSEGNAVFEISGPLTDGTYDLLLLKAADPSKTSEAVYLTVDTRAPVLKWKNEGPGSALGWGSELLAYNKISADEVVIEYGWNGNFSSVAAIKGFDPYVAGVQQVSVTASDRAGNISNAIERSVEITPPASPRAITNAGFEDASGFSSNSYTSASGGNAPGWDMELNVLRRVNERTYGPNSHSTVEFTEGGPFRVDSDEWADHYYCYVRSEIEEPGVTPVNTDNNALWFAGDYNCGYSLARAGNALYAKSWGTVSQSGFDIYKNVRYRFSVWTRNGSDNRPDPAAALCIQGPELMQFDTDGDLSTWESVGTVLKGAAATDEEYEQIVLDFTPDRDGSVEIQILKNEAGGNDGCFTFFDNVEFDIAPGGITFATP